VGVALIQERAIQLKVELLSMHILKPPKSSFFGLYLLHQN